jgi:C4-dicarboxylate-specific signal transduction histidine kinase
MVLAGRFTILQVIINLAGNAIEAMQADDRLPFRATRNM